MKKILLNIFLGVLLVVTLGLMAYAVISMSKVPSDKLELSNMTLYSSISWVLVWTYALLGLGILSVIVCALVGMIKNPSGIVWTCLAFVLVVAIVGASYYFSLKHQVTIANPADKVGSEQFFEAKETLIAQTCLLVTYVAFAASFLTVLATEVWRRFK